MEFRSDFICGNGKLIEYRKKDGEDYILFIAEQKFNEAKPVWFYFRVNGLESSRVTFRIGNAHQFLCDTDISSFVGDAPVYRAPDGQWKRTAKCTVTFEEDGFPVVEFVIDNCPPEVEVAFCFPYGPAQLENTMSKLDCFQKKCIGYTTKGNPIYRYATDGGRKTDKPGLYLTSRQHAQEVGGAWVLDGILNYFGSEEGRKYRERLSIWVTPMVDVDGVIYGAYGKDQAIGDMNRAWTSRFQKRTEVDCVIQDMDRWYERCNAKYVMDVHSPAHEVPDMLLNIYPERLTEEHVELLKGFVEHINLELTGTGLEPFKPNIVPPMTLGSSQGTSNTIQQFTEEYFHIPAFILEMTYEGSKEGRLFEIEDYLAYGKYIAITIAKTLLNEYDDIGGDGE